MRLSNLKTRMLETMKEKKYMTTSEMIQNFGHKFSARKDELNKSLEMEGLPTIKSKYSHTNENGSKVFIYFFNEPE